jgi:hypothetical protein
MRALPCPPREERIRCWVPVEDVAKHLGVVKAPLHRRIEHRGRPAHKISPLWKFKLTEVDAWVRAGGVDQEDGDKDRAR